MGVFHGNRDAEQVKLLGLWTIVGVELQEREKR